MVPEVMTTLLKRSKTGLMASEGSRQLLDVSQASHYPELVRHTRSGRWDLVQWHCQFQTALRSTRNLKARDSRFGFSGKRM